MSFKKLQKGALFATDVFTNNSKKFYFLYKYIMLQSSAKIIMLGIIMLYFEEYFDIDVKCYFFFSAL